MNINACIVDDNFKLGLIITYIIIQIISEGGRTPPRKLSSDGENGYAVTTELVKQQLREANSASQMNVDVRSIVPISLTVRRRRDELICFNRQYYSPP